VTIVMANGDKPIALGTGFLVRQDGVIVTNYHVIATGNVAVVKFADGTISPVDGVLAAEKVRDLAVIKIHGRTFPTLTLGNSEQIQVGEEVVAIGNPLGLELSVSNGIVSGIRTDKEKGGELLQITAPISHGSSGGPLFNMFGEVIGINAMFLEGGENLNFAIPVNDAKRLLQNQSTRLQPLPNEPENTRNTGPAKSDGSTGQPTDPGDAIARCSEQAKAYAKDQESSRWSYQVYANHYDAKASVCYVVIRQVKLNLADATSETKMTVADAFENNIVGYFLGGPFKNDAEGYDTEPVRDCRVDPPKGETIFCRKWTGDVRLDFERLVTKYFGVKVPY